MISIVIVSYNRLESLRRCLRSVERNAKAPCETIVVDNGSWEDYGGLAGEFPHIRVLRVWGKIGAMPPAAMPA